MVPGEAGSPAGAGSAPPGHDSGRHGRRDRPPQAGARRRCRRARGTPSTAPPGPAPYHRAVEPGTPSPTRHLEAAPRRRHRSGLRVAAWVATVLVGIGGVVAVSTVERRSTVAAVDPAVTARTDPPSTRPAAPRTDDPSEALEQIRAQDAPVVASLAESWVAQLSARPAATPTADRAATDAAVLSGHEALRKRYPGSVLLWSPDWNYAGRSWITVMNKQLLHGGGGQHLGATGTGSRRRTASRRSCRVPGPSTAARGTAGETRVAGRPAAHGNGRGPAPASRGPGRGGADQRRPTGTPAEALRNLPPDVVARATEQAQAMDSTDAQLDELVRLFGRPAVSVDGPNGARSRVWGIGRSVPVLHVPWRAWVAVGKRCSTGGTGGSASWQSRSPYWSSSVSASCDRLVPLDHRPRRYRRNIKPWRNPGAAGRSPRRAGPTSAERRRSLAVQPEEPSGERLLARTGSCTRSARSPRVDEPAALACGDEPPGLPGRGAGRSATRSAFLHDSGRRLHDRCAAPRATCRFTVVFAADLRAGRTVARRCPAAPGLHQLRPLAVNAVFADPDRRARRCPYGPALRPGRRRLDDGPDRWARRSVGRGHHGLSEHPEGLRCVFIATSRPEHPRTVGVAVAAHIGRVHAEHVLTGEAGESGWQLGPWVLERAVRGTEDGRGRATRGVPVPRSAALLRLAADRQRREREGRPSPAAARLGVARRSTPTATCGPTQTSRPGPPWKRSWSLVRTPCGLRR